MPQLLDIHRSGSQIRYGNFTVYIRGVGTGNQIGTSTIGVNAKFPARQIFPSSVVLVISRNAVKSGVVT